MNQKPFLIYCNKCRWSMTSMGTKEDLKDLVEIRPNCSTCGKFRKFQCPKCSQPSTMKRVRGNT